MKRGVLLIPSVVAALALAAPAAAKNISELKLCGPAACASITDASLLRRWEQGGGQGPAAAPPIGAFYRFDTVVTAAPGEHFENGQTSITWSDWYVPRAGSGLMRGTDEGGYAAWSRVDATVNAGFRAAVRNLDPFPAPAITAASVGGRKVADPASYARLFDSSWPRTHDASQRGWKEVRLRSAAPSPWTDGKNVVFFAPKRRVLERDGTYVRVPRPVATALARARSLRGSGPARTGVKLAAFGAAAALLAASLAVYRRRRPD